MKSHVLCLMLSLRKSKFATSNALYFESTFDLQSTPVNINLERAPVAQESDYPKMVLLLTRTLEHIVLLKT
jgi:hypothetical protein